ncbi:MAG: DUF5335 family protein [Thermoanaerobaculia bacterium]
MRNRLVPRSEWFRFFDEFSRRHQGWPATVHVLSPKLGSQVEARDMPLEGIVSRADATGPISIHLGSAPPRSNIEHEIEDPRQVWVELSEAGAEEALDVESEDGTKTVIQFRAAQVRRGH